MDSARVVNVSGECLYIIQPSQYSLSMDQLIHFISSKTGIAYHEIQLLQQDLPFTTDQWVHFFTCRCDNSDDEPGPMISYDGIEMAPRCPQCPKLQLTLVRVPEFSYVAAGGDHTLLVRTNGTVRAIGRNDCGQCDVPLVSLDSAPPLFHDVFRNPRFIQCAAGDDHSVFLRSDGKVMGAGDNCYDQSDMQSVHCLGKGSFAVISFSMYDIMWILHWLHPLTHRYELHGCSFDSTSDCKMWGGGEVLLSYLCKCHGNSIRKQFVFIQYTQISDGSS